MDELPVVARECSGGHWGIDESPQDTRPVASWRLRLARGLSALTLAVAVNGCLPAQATPDPLGAGSPTTPGSTTQAALPNELARSTWLEFDDDRDVWLAGTLGGVGIELPGNERAIAATDGRVVTVDIPAQGLEGQHVFVRDIGSHELIASADTPAMIAWAVLGSEAVYVSGRRPDPQGPLGQAVEGEIPGLWRLAFDGTVTTIAEPRPAPAAWEGQTFSRVLIPTPSEDLLFSGTCRMEGFTIGPLPCDLEVLDGGTFAASELARGVVVTPMLATDKELIVMQRFGDRDVIAAMDLDGRTQWRTEFQNAVGGYVDPIDGRLILGYRPDRFSEDLAIASIALDSGARSEVLRWRPSDAGYFHPSLSAGRFAVFGSGSPEAGVSISRSLLSVLDVGSGNFVARDVPAPWTDAVAND